MKAWLTFTLHHCKSQVKRVENADPVAPGTFESAVQQPVHLKLHTDLHFSLAAVALNECN